MGAARAAPLPFPLIRAGGGPRGTSAIPAQLREPSDQLKTLKRRGSPRSSESTTLQPLQGSKKLSGIMGAQAVDTIALQKL